VNVRSTALTALVLALVACDPVEELVPDDYPVVLGGAPAEDLDPALEVAEYALRVGQTEVELIEGLSTTMWTYNGTSPGPLLQARVGDLVRVHVTNDLDEPTTVHWHGLRIPVAMDGVAVDGVDPIEPGETFTYEFTVPDAGTFWYHPHIRSKVQVEAGLYGVFVVHEEDALAPEVDADRIFVFDDVLLTEDGEIAPHTDAHMTQMHGRFGNVILANGGERADRVHLAPGAVERWRIVNTANARTMWLAFAGLEVREIGADGGLWRQDWTRDIADLVLPVGARTELEVRLADDVTDGELDLMLPDTNLSGDLIWVPSKLVPVRLDPEAAPSSADGYTAEPSPELPDADAGTDPGHDVEFNGVSGPDGIEWQINGYSWPDFPDWSVDRGTTQVVEIRNLAGPEHPFHLHGQLFTVLTRDGEDADQPGLRDTVLVGGMQTVRIAVNFDNPGRWMYHCHILEHADLGMMALVDVR